MLMPAGWIGGQVFKNGSGTIEAACAVAEADLVCPIVKSVNGAPKAKKVQFRVGLLAILLLGPAGSASATDNGIDLDQVFIRVKQEVGYYQSTNPKSEAQWQELLQRLKIVKPGTDDELVRDGICGKRRVVFDITRVKMEFTTTRQVSGSAEASIKVPFGSIEAAGVGKADKKSTQQITYTYYPKVEDRTEDLADYAFLKKDDTAVIQPVLQALRDSLLKAKVQKPCFGNTPKEGAEPNIFSFDVELTKSENINVGFNFWLVSSEAALGHETKTGNRITATFVPRELDDRERPRPHGQAGR